jgi:alkanesulfonate monooxygenase SsuD/methylene tetrahydromethanopterin reductase-like flavin-dependent oxidoreductase (luciferase family)
MPPHLEFWLYLPQMRMTMAQMVERAQVAEAAGFAGVAGMDHMTPPLAEGSAMFEAMTTSAWLAARTERLGVGSLVLCDSFRHPAVLASQAVTLDHASGGRFELGLGWGSVVDDFTVFGVGSPEARHRIGRLKESLEIVTALWTGEAVDYEGEHFTLRGARQGPTPLGKIPLTIGGAGPKTMQLVAAHADWWNVHVAILDRFDEMRPHAGAARCSLQAQIGLVTPSHTRDEVAQLTQRRFGERAMVGTGAELVDAFGAIAERGVERVYAWFSDFATPATLNAFGDDVIPHFSTP